jgi:hypothetical protein
MKDAEQSLEVKRWVAIVYAYLPWNEPPLHAEDMNATLYMTLLSSSFVLGFLYR